MALTMFKTQQPPIQSEIVTVTPETATYLLSKNAKFNRKVNKSTVAKYAKAMLAGEWSLSPQGIIIDDTTGSVIDGQHRLFAVVETGVTIPMYVTYVTDSDTFKFLDQGRNRNFSDLSGVSNKVTSTVQQALRISDVKRKGVSYIQAEPYIFGRLGQEVQELHDEINPRGHMWGNAVFKCVAVCSIISGTMAKSEVYSLYKDFMTLNTHNMSSARKNFLRQVMNREVIGTQTPDKAIVAKGYNVFSEDGDKHTISRYTYSSYEKGLNMIQKAVQLGK